MSSPSALTPSFDQVVEGNVNIKKLSKKNYKIKFTKISKFLKYQTWSESSKTLNDDRSVYYQKAKTWINDFNSFNRLNKASNKLLFTPTTVMEIGNHKYLFVIDEAEVNGKGRIVFKVSTKEIELSEKKMLKLPCGHHDDVRFDIDSFNFADLSTTPLPFGSCPILIGADTIDLTQVGLFMFNVFTIQDCIAQSLNLFLNPASYWKGLGVSSNSYFNINNPNLYDTSLYDANYLTNADWLPNSYGSGSSYWYNCVGADQNYVAYQLQYFAMIYSYIYTVLQGNAPQTVTVPIYTTNVGWFSTQTPNPNNPTQVGNLSFNTAYPLQLNTLSFITLGGDAVNNNYSQYTTPYSRPTNSNAFFLYDNDGYLSFDNINEGFGAPNTLIVPPLSLSQAFPQSSFNGPINYTSNNSVITVIPSQGGFGQAAMLSFVTFNISISNNSTPNPFPTNNVSTPNPFPPGSSPQTVTITASQNGQTPQTLNLTIIPNMLSFLNQNGSSSNTVPEGYQVGPPWNTFTNGLLSTNLDNSVFTFQLQQLILNLTPLTSAPFTYISQSFIANAFNNYTNFFSTNMQVLSSDGLPLQAGFSSDALIPVPLSSGSNQNGKWLFVLTPIPFQNFYYNSVGNQATVVFTCTANGGFYFANDASAQASNAVITNNAQIITFTLPITLPTTWAI